jgi:hypothetical protein
MKKTSIKNNTVENRLKKLTFFKNDEYLGGIFDELNNAYNILYTNICNLSADNSAEKRGLKFSMILEGDISDLKDILDTLGVYIYMHIYVYIYACLCI